MEKISALPKDTKLLRLVSARHDMGDSLEAFAILEAIQNPQDPMFYHAAISMTVCYGRPFTANEGVGSLKDAYPSFPDFEDPEMNLRHYRLMDLRHKFMAHSSCEGTKVMILPAGTIHPITSKVVENLDHLVGKRTFGNLQFFRWLRDVVWALKGRLDVDVRKRLVEVAGTLTIQTEMETGYDSFKWTVPQPKTTKGTG